MTWVACHAMQTLPLEASITRTLIEKLICKKEFVNSKKIGGQGYFIFVPKLLTYILVFFFFLSSNSLMRDIYSLWVK